MADGPRRHVTRRPTSCRSSSPLPASPGRGVFLSAYFLPGSQHAEAARRRSRFVRACGRLWRRGGTGGHLRDLDRSACAGAITTPTASTHHVARPADDLSLGRARRRCWRPALHSCGRRCACPRLSRRPPDGCEPDFLDDSRVLDAARLALPDFTVLSAADLHANLAEADQAWLRLAVPGMAYNLRYWRPQTVGEVVFNWWD
jgi:hypothetical protein